MEMGEGSAAFGLEELEHANERGTIFQIFYIL